MDKIIRDTIERHGVNSVGWGRGSAAGSLVSYCLGLTDLDPIQYGLLFERFLDESRKDPPDIDTDFDSRIREQVKGRIVEMFGEQHTCSIGTYQTYKTRAVIVDVARAIGLDVFEANEVTKKMDSLATFDVEDDEGDISEMNIDSMDFDDVCKQYPELESYFKKYPEVRQHAEILRNQVKNMGKHAGGVIISNLNLQDRIPVVKTKDGVVSTWVEGQASHELSEVGLVKFDILGLNHLPVIDDALKLLEQHRGIKMNRQEIPINDRDAIKVGSHDDLVGIFQLDSPQTKPVVDAVQMDSIFDISAVTSLIRPGPKDMGMHMTYARRKHGEPYDMPEFLREQSSETHGVLTYQEQCCVGDSLVRTDRGVIKLVDVVDLVENGEDVFVDCVNEDLDLVKRIVESSSRSGVREVVKITLDNGLVLECTDDHRILTTNRGWVRVRDLNDLDDICTLDDIKR
jgi:DNA polymerase-3 subunit alpha